jgi:magnesium transporter
MVAITTLKAKNGFVWIDVFNPKRADILNLAQTYSLHSTSVQDCLDPEHLPKFEKISNYSFLILRAFDEKCLDTSDTVQEVTRKIAIFFNENFLITIHRKDQNFLSALRDKWKSEMEYREDVTSVTILADLLKNVYLTFEKPIDDGLTELENHEMSIFSAQGSKPFTLANGYYLKRKAFVYKRVLRLSFDATSKLINQHEFSTSPLFHDLKETLDNLYFYADELVESVNALINLYISMEQQKINEASHRANEVVRVLTIFSVFFMPLNFIASVYGMNFEFMPELQVKWGYPAILSIMLFTAASIYWWFRRKKWL